MGKMLIFIFDVRLTVEWLLLWLRYFYLSDSGIRLRRAGILCFLYYYRKMRLFWLHLLLLPNWGDYCFLGLHIL